MVSWVAPQRGLIDMPIKLSLQLIAIRRMPAPVTPLLPRSGLVQYRFRPDQDSSSILTRNPYSHRAGISIHITPERLFTWPGIRTMFVVARLEMIISWVSSRIHRRTPTAEVGNYRPESDRSDGCREGRH